MKAVRIAAAFFGGGALKHDTAMRLVGIGFVLGYMKNSNRIAVEFLQPNMAEKLREVMCLAGFDGGVWR